jgi:O-antigen ligase
MHSHQFRRARGAGSTIDMYTLVAITAFAYASIGQPLLVFITRAPNTGLWTASKLQEIIAPSLENRIVWPLLAMIAVVLAVRNWSRFTFPPHIVSLLAYLALAGISVLWAFNPPLSFQRFVLQMMILAAVVLPVMLTDRRADVIRGLFLCFGLACILNFCIVLNQEPLLFKTGEIFGYRGYFTDKNTLGHCTAIAFLLSLHEMLYSGRRRILGTAAMAITIGLVIVSHSKAALGLAILAPIMAGLMLTFGRTMRISPTIFLLSILIGYLVLSTVWGNLVNRISWYVYGDYTLSGRSLIWDFANYEIARRPLLGWGYQSFWLAGPDAPSIVDAPGWIKSMPHAHNGYLDTMLEMGYLGFALLVIFIVATLHAIGRLAERDPRRAWILLSLALFVILANFLESIWMRGQAMSWLLFALVAADAARYRQPARFRRAQHRQLPAARGRPVIVERPRRLHQRGTRA